jgi:uncharacterized protein CbrC (UPF0167 family)
MAVHKFDCDSCGAHGSIKYKEDIQFKETEIVYCPFCGADISEDEVYDEED